MRAQERSRWKSPPASHQPHLAHSLHCVVAGSCLVFLDSVLQGQWSGERQARLQRHNRAGSTLSGETWSHLGCGGRDTSVTESLRLRFFHGHTGIHNPIRIHRPVEGLLMPGAPEKWGAKLVQECCVGGAVAKVGTGRQAFHTFLRASLTETSFRKKDLLNTR